jgi:hypothetical protein
MKEEQEKYFIVKERIDSGSKDSWKRFGTLLRRFRKGEYP